LKQAVSEDSTFALAWYQLASTGEWLFDPDLTIAAARNAARHKERLPDRGRRLVEALYAGKIGSNREALRLYRDFLSSFPDDVEAWYQLAELEFHTGPLLGVRPAESLRAWERLLFYEPDQITALIHSALIHVSAGNWQDVESIASRVIELEPAAERNIELLAHLRLSGEDVSPGADLRELLVHADEDMLMDVLWSLGAFRDSPSYAENVVPYMVDSSRPTEARAMGHVIRAYLAIAEGRLRDAERSFQTASQLDYPLASILRQTLLVLPYRRVASDQVQSAIRSLEALDSSRIPPSRLGGAWLASHDDIHEHLRQYMLGLLYARVGDADAAGRSASWLEESSTPIQFGSLASDLALAVRAENEIIRGDTLAAAQYLQRAERRIWYQYSLTSPVSSHGRERFLDGLVEGTIGSPESGIEMLGFLSDYSLFDWAYVAPAHFYSGNLAEELDQKELAIQHYERFVELWKDCDEELRPLVAKARIRLDSLRPE
jgi:tetratricopeptide (TPR) repeat protein